MSPAQVRLIETIQHYGECAEYWPVVNDWVKDAGPHRSLALRNIERTVAALKQAGLIVIDEEGCFQLTSWGRAFVVRREARRDR